MRSIKPENQIKRRIKELNSIFSAMDEDHKKVVAPLIDFAAHMEVNLRRLDKDLEKVGFVEEYSNGENQTGRKESTESRAYSTMIKNYTGVIRTLLSCLPESAQPAAEDELGEFLRSRMKR